MKLSQTEPIIELRLWRQFVAVADVLHFGQAAASLHMSQPPLTQAIQRLEAILQVRLFERTKRSVKLTAAGLALLPHAKDLLLRAQALPLTALAAASGEVGVLRLAFVSTVGFSHLPKWVRRFRERFPQVQLELMEATGDVQEAALKRAEIDAGFMLHAPGFAPPELCCLSIDTEPMVLAVPEFHRLAQVKQLDVQDVLDDPIVIFPRRIVPSLHDAVFGLYSAAGHLPVVAQEAIQMQTIINLVSAGLGLAWVPQSVQHFQRTGVVYRDVGRAAPRCETSLVWTQANIQPALGRFMAFMHEELAA